MLGNFTETLSFADTEQLKKTQKKTGKIRLQKVSSSLS